MATPVQEERVEVAALKSDYQFGFHDPDQSVFRARKGLDKDIVAQMSEIKGEPGWMRDVRLNALEIFQQKPMPLWGGRVDDIDFDDIYYYVKPADREGRTWDDVPDNIKKTFDRLGIPKPNGNSWPASARSTIPRWCTTPSRKIWSARGSSSCPRTRPCRNIPTCCASTSAPSFPRKTKSLRRSIPRCGAAAASCTCRPG